MTATKTSPDDDMSRDAMLTHCERSALYHQERERFLSWAHSTIQYVLFATPPAGATLYFGEIVENSGLTIGISVLIGLLAWLSLVWNPVGKMYLHKSLCRDFTLLAGKIYANTNPKGTISAKWKRKIHALYAEEPPVFYALLVQCANQLVVARDEDKKYLVELCRYHRWFRNIRHFQDVDFKNRDQEAKEERKLAAAKKRAEKQKQAPQKKRAKKKSPRKKSAKKRAKKKRP
ncbi:MAG: hypothetical protein MPL62_13625 [Alphaproteobacteria bacterium]|nr:hypothetical protein [Alphaproteobacteria bacterium]